ncbi:MAG: ThuA domain-containing protein [Planctomycetota bacterium]
MAIGHATAGLLPAQDCQTFRVLVFSKTSGFRHNNQINAGQTLIQSLGDANDFDVDMSEDATLFTAANLSQYAAVIFLNTTGNILDASQETAFENYITNGGGFVGIHSATDTEYGWPFYGSLVGAYFQNHPSVQSGEVTVVDPNHPSTFSLPTVFTHTDEWYNFQSNPANNPLIKVLITLDESTYSGGNMGAVHPIAWCQDAVGQGRSWYTAFGHRVNTYTEPFFVDHLLGGILFAAGRVDSWSPLGGGLSAPCDALIATPTGDVIAGGSFASAGGASANHIARWDGATWSPLGTGVDDDVAAIALLPNGDLAAGGSFSIAGGSPANRIARWDGSSWSALGAGMNGAVQALTALPNGDLIAGGSFTSAGGGAAARIAIWNGSSWSALGSGMDDDVHALLTLPNGDVVAGGQFSSAGGVAANLVARWDGSTWSPMGTLPNGLVVQALTAMPSGDVVAAGEFGPAGGSSAGDGYIARWDGASWVQLGSGANGGVAALTSLPNGDLVGAGSFTEMDGVRANHIARWDSSEWSPLRLGTAPSIRALTTAPDGGLIVGGAFTSAGGNSASRVARYEPCLSFHSAYGSGCYSPGLTLSASPNPVSTATTGTIVTYTVDNVPDATGASGSHIGAVIVSFGSDVPGTDLGFLGAPGCNLHIASLDVPTSFANATGSTSNTTTLTIPAAVPAGSAIYAQAVALTVSGLLNQGGLTTSNGVRSWIYEK